MVILAILAGVVVMAVGGIFGQAKSRAYDTIKPQIQNGVTAFTTANNGDLPENVSSNRYTIRTEAGQNISQCYVFDLCSIVGVGEILRQVPDGCYSDPDGGSGSAQGTITTWNDDPPSNGNTYYVSNAGNDSTGNGSHTNPWKTIGKAATMVAPGDSPEFTFPLFQFSLRRDQACFSLSGSALIRLTPVPCKLEI
jgi:hypothetical protein